MANDVNPETLVHAKFQADALAGNSSEVTIPAKGQVVEITSPYSLIESAVARGATVETLEKLMALQERHEANEARKQFFAAMQKFQGLKPELKRSAKVDFTGKSGVNTNYNFCPLSEIEKALKGPLSECGLSYRFENFSEDGLIGIKCIVSHVSGHSESTPMKAPVDVSGNKNGIQAIGSTSTYLMRYTLIAAFGLTTADDDDDGSKNSEFPMQKLMSHNTVLRNKFSIVADMKDAVAAKDFYEMAANMDKLTDEEKTALWVAPTAGGIFTTAERAAFKSNEFLNSNARADYYAEKETKQETVK